MEASLREQINATHEIIKMEKKTLELTKQRLHIGSVTELDVLAQETLLAQAAATLPPLETSLAQTRHALAVLIGSYPGDKELPHFELKDLHLPEEIPVSLPSTLIRQRPDIRAAEALLHQASAEIGVATANMLPTFPMVGFYGPFSDTLSDFFGKNNIAWTWQLDVLQPIFHGGALYAQREAAIGTFKAAFAQYEGVVLSGLQNVADSLSALENDAKELKETAIAAKAAKETWDLTQKQYKLGGATYLDVIVAELAYQQTYLARIQAQSARFADTAALFQSLGGGWWVDEDEYSEQES
jgi:NodT family efflux transporter outer membrane factor (OMF) lipoprotein